MIITDKKEMWPLFYDEVLMQHNVIALEDGDYRDCQKVGEENFAISVKGKTLADAMDKLRAEMPNKSEEFIDALILYIKGSEITMDEMNAVNDFMEQLPDDTIARWGIGKNNDGSTDVKLMLFAFVAG